MLVREPSTNRQGTLQKFSDEHFWMSCSWKIIQLYRNGSMKCISISWNCNEAIVVGWFYIRKCHSQPILKPPIDTLCLKECPVLLPRSFYPSISPVPDPTLPKAHSHEFPFLIHAFLSHACSIKHSTARPLGQNEERIGMLKPVWHSALPRILALPMHPTDITAEAMCVCVSALEEGATRSNIYPATFST